IITECSRISEAAHGILRAPGIYNDAQVAAWRRITDAVHAAGGRIVNQIWHPGRVSHPAILGGKAPVAPSPLAAAGDFFLPSGRVAFTTPRELRAEELPGIVEDFARAARNARSAGFDGVEIHAANGYLLQQFLEEGSNRRRDAYGGSIERRARLTLEVVEALIAAWDEAHGGVRLSPAGVHYGMGGRDRPPAHGYLTRALGGRRPGRPRAARPTTAPLRSAASATFTSSGPTRPPSPRGRCRSTTCRPSPARASPARSSSMAASSAPPPRRCSPRGMPTSWPSAYPSLPTPTWSGAWPAMPPTTGRTPRPSTGWGLRATRTILCSRRLRGARLVVVPGSKVSNAVIASARRERSHPGPPARASGWRCRLCRRAMTMAVREGFA